MNVLLFVSDSTYVIVALVFIAVLYLLTREKKD